MFFGFPLRALIPIFNWEAKLKKRIFLDLMFHEVKEQFAQQQLCIPVVVKEMLEMGTKVEQRCISSVLNIF